MRKTSYKLDQDPPESGFKSFRLQELPSARSKVVLTVSQQNINPQIVCKKRLYIECMLLVLDVLFCIFV